MNELATYQGGLPDTIEDLAHFLLIAPEKATAMRAEIRAIQKVGLAKAVYDQKLEEQRRLCDMILDASVRLGEMTKAIAKAPPDRKSEKYQTDSAVGVIKTKSETVQELGFSPKQVQRFETLADNKDLVELEKAKAREEGRMPTRTNVIDMAQARKKMYDRDIERLEDSPTVSGHHLRPVKTTGLIARCRVGNHRSHRRRSAAGSEHSGASYPEVAGNPNSTEKGGT